MLLGIKRCWVSRGSWIYSQDILEYAHPCARPRCVSFPPWIVDGRWKHPGAGINGTSPQYTQIEHLEDDGTHVPHEHGMCWRTLKLGHNLCVGLPNIHEAYRMPVIY